jgi:hypothetical protein
LVKVGSKKKSDANEEFKEDEEKGKKVVKEAKIYF